MKRFALTLAFIFATVAGLQSSCLAAGELTGLGIILGDTTGISFKQYFERHMAFDLALGAPYGYNVYPGVSVHGDVMWTDEMAKMERGALLFHVGGGLALAQGGGSDNFEIGVRFTTGVEYFIPRSKFAIFGELVPTFILAHDPGARLHAAVGGRYYF